MSAVATFQSVASVQLELPFKLLVCDVIYFHQVLLVGVWDKGCKELFFFLITLAPSWVVLDCCILSNKISEFSSYLSGLSEVCHL